MHVVVIGAGLGGLTSAALLLKAGHQVTVLEAHVYAGGCAGTFFHQGYRFDAGATLAGGFNNGGPHHRLAELLGIEFPVHPVDPAWVTHLPDRSITQWADAEAWREERTKHFPQAEKFWKKQEQLADISWDISSRDFPWTPQSLRDVVSLGRAMRPQTLAATPYLFSTVASLIPNDSSFKTFIDAQLLIAAQTTSDYTNVLYGSAALDLPRRGVNHVRGGIGSLAKTLANWIRTNGGEVLYRQQVEKIEMRNGKAVAVQTDKGLRVECDALIANLTPWALNDLLGEHSPQMLRREVHTRSATWGAFTLYLGLDELFLPAQPFADHHQVVVDPTLPLGEGNSVFISISDRTDLVRAPKGMRAVTLSTHTHVESWMNLRRDKQAYEDRRADYAERLLKAVERVIPNVRSAIRLCLPGTPYTFEFYTGRPQGMVGGFPQTSLFNVRGPRVGLENVWMVGDSIFPGQSTAGVTLGGMRVANDVQYASQNLERKITRAHKQFGARHI